MMILRAQRALDSAALLLANDDLVGAANRAYYAVFYAARAVLSEHAGIDLSNVRTHSGLRRVFNLHVVKTGLLSPDVATHYGQIEGIRTAGDYSAQALDASDVETAIADARAFVSACVWLLDSAGR